MWLKTQRMVPSSEDLSEGRGLWYIEERERGPIGPGEGIWGGSWKTRSTQEDRIAEGLQDPGLLLFSWVRSEALRGLWPWSDKDGLMTSVANRTKGAEAETGDSLEGSCISLGEISQWLIPEREQKSPWELIGFWIYFEGGANKIGQIECGIRESERGIKIMISRFWVEPFRWNSCAWAQEMFRRSKMEEVDWKLDVIGGVQGTYRLQQERGAIGLAPEKKQAMPLWQP